MARERSGGWVDVMAEISYRRLRLPSDVIQHAVWLYLCFTLSYRDVERLLAECGLDISCETIGGGVVKVGAVVVRRLRRRPRPCRQPRCRPVPPGSLRAVDTEKAVPLWRRRERDSNRQSRREARMR